MSTTWTRCERILSEGSDSRLVDSADRRVRLRVSHGIRGGVGTEVRITIGLLSSGRIVLIERAPDLHAAIDRVVDRLARTIVRRMDRSRSTRLERIMPGKDADDRTWRGSGCDPRASR